MKSNKLQSDFYDHKKEKINNVHNLIMYPTKRLLEKYKVKAHQTIENMNKRNDQTEVA